MKLQVGRWSRDAIRALLALVALLFALLPVDRAFAVGWVTPTGNTDGVGWSAGASARDDNTSTYASHQPVIGWGDWEVFSLGASIWSDRFRVSTDFGYGEVDQVQLDVSADGSSWVTAFIGAVADASWDTETFAAQNVRYARFRYHRVAVNYVFWLYEFDFYETPPSVDPPVVTTTPATSVESTSAIVHGSLDDSGGVPCDVRLQYGLTLAYELGSTAWAANYDAGQTFGVVLSGLSDGQTYHFRAQARNEAATSSGADATFTCAAHGAGWISPTSDSDLSGNWQQGSRAHDDEPTTYADCYHEINDVDGQWSPYLYLTHSLVNVDSVRFVAKDDVNIDSAEIDLSADGTSWTAVFSGAFSNETWTSSGFAVRNADRARVRFHLAGNNVGMHWAFHELDLHVARLLSVTVSDDVMSFGPISLNTWLPPDSTVVSNDSGETESFDARISPLQSGPHLWTLSNLANGANQVRAQWSTTSAAGPWTDVTAYDTAFTIASGLDPADAVTLFVRIQTPTSSDAFGPYSTAITVTAW